MRPSVWACRPIAPPQMPSDNSDVQSLILPAIERDGVLLSYPTGVALGEPDLPSQPCGRFDAGNR